MSQQRWLSQHPSASLAKTTVKEDTAIRVLQKSRISLSIFLSDFYHDLRVKGSTFFFFFFLTPALTGQRCCTSLIGFHSIRRNTPLIWTIKFLHIPLMLLIKEVRNSREESRTSQQGLHKRFCSTRNTSVKAKWQVWMDMKGNKPNRSKVCTTSASFYLMQSFLLTLCASPGVLQSTIWADKPKFTITANKQFLSALSGKGRWEQISDVPAAVCPN